MKKTYFSVILGLILLISSVSLGRQKAEWKGRVERKDGVPSIINPGEPLYPEDALRLEEDLTIPSPDDVDLSFQDLNYLVVDDEENIYVSDSKAGHILVFDRSGEFVRTIGRRGRGPGEMSWPREIQILRGKELFVFDSGQGKVHEFTLEGNFIRQTATNHIPAFRLPKADSAGNIVVGQLNRGKPFKAVLKKVDPQLNLICEIASAITTTQPPILNIFEMRWQTTFVWNVNKNDEIIWGNFDKYEISVCDPDGNGIKKIIKEHDGVPIDKEDQKKLIREYFGDNPVPRGMTLEFPDRYPPFIYLTCDEEGRIFALSYVTIDDDGTRHLDVFDPEGRYIVRIRTRSFPQIWKNGMMYCVGADADGFEIIRRFRLKWGD
jgi:hypothetical protein